MKVQLDRAKCTGHAQCNAVAPELFPIDDLGYSVLEQHTVEPEYEEATRAGVNACPEGALTLQDE